MEVRVGTSGFSYAEWKGAFYPAGTKPKEMLQAYASRLDTVEINNTFYRLPRPEVLEGWARETPPTFRFAIKASRRITHFARLANCDELVSALVSGVRVLGERLGCVLFQLPPTFRVDLPRLSDFLARLPQGAESVPVVLEFRHESWFDDGLYELLSKHGAALCGGEGDDEGRVPPPLVKTTDFAYLRLRKDFYEPRELEDWARRITDLGAPRVFVYFKHETTGPFLAEQLGALLRAGAPRALP